MEKKNVKSVENNVMNNVAAEVAAETIVVNEVVNEVANAAETIIVEPVVAPEVDTRVRRMTVTASVISTSTDFVNVFDYDDDGNVFVKKDENGNLIKRRIVNLKLDESVPCVLDEKHNFAIGEKNVISFSAARLQDIVKRIAPSKVNRQFTKFYEKTGRTLVNASCLEAIMDDAAITVEVTVHYPGDVYTVNGEQRTTTYQNYDYDIIDGDIEDDSIAEFKEELADNVADILAEIAEAKTEAERERAAIAATAAANNNAAMF